MLNSIPIELHAHIFSFVRIKIFCLLTQTNHQMNYLCDMAMGFYHNLIISVNEEYLEQKRNYFLKFIEKKGLLDDVLGTIYFYSLKSKFGHAMSSFDVAYYLDQCANEYNDGFNKSHIEIVKKNIKKAIILEGDMNEFSKRVKILKSYIKQYKLDFYDTYIFKKYIKTYFKNFVVPEIHEYDMSRINNNYISKIMSYKNDKLYVDLHKLKKYYRGIKSEHIDNGIINLKDVLMNRMFLSTNNYDNITEEINIYEEYKKLNPRKDIKIYFNNNENFKFSDLGYLLIIFDNVFDKVLEIEKKIEK